jgi:predicted choloylglycine hydrolase
VRRDHACTNQFKNLTEENRHILEDSKKRLEIIEEKQVQELNDSQAFQLLNHTDKGIFSKLYGSWAGMIHTSAYLPN